MHDIIIEIREKECVHVHHLEISKYDLFFEADSNDTTLFQYSYV